MNLLAEWLSDNLQQIFHIELSTTILTKGKTIFIENNLVADYRDVGLAAKINNSATPYIRSCCQTERGETEKEMNIRERAREREKIQVQRKDNVGGIKPL